MDRLLKSSLIIGLAVCAAPAISQPENVFGLVGGNGGLYSSDINGETQNSESAGVRGVYFEYKKYESMSLYSSLKKTENLCFKNCSSYYSSINSVEVSAKYSKELMSSVNLFGRLGGHFYNSEAMFDSWRLAHNTQNNSKLGAAAAVGFDFNPQGKIRIGLEYDILSIQSSETLRTLAISIGISL